VAQFVSSRAAARAETALVTAAASTLVAIVSWPAFHAWFFGEAFLYLGQYWGARERFVAALFSPSDMSFFKPVCFAASLPWYFLLPPDPLAYHLRNFALTVVVLALLHRVLLRVAPSRPARILAVMLFAASKVHLTTIGYLMIFDSILMLTLLLLAVLATLRWCASGAPGDRLGALAATALCALTKDYGVVAVAVVAAIAATRDLDAPASARRRMLVAWLVPLAAIAVGRMALRHAVVGPMPWSHPVYAPHFSLAEIGRKSLVFVSALTNASIGWHDKTGASGVGALVARGVPRAFAGGGLEGFGDGRGGAAVDALVGTVLVIALTATVLAAWRCRRAFVVPLVWMAAFFAPPLLVRNLQIYYAYEPLAGTVVLLAIAWSALAPAWRHLGATAVATIAIGGMASNHFAKYDWQYAADRARAIAPVIAAQRGSPIRSLSLLTSDKPFWSWTLTADDKAPMLEFLLQRPGLPVRLYDRGVLALPMPALDARDLVLDADADFAPLTLPAAH
jgi:hypothetical protein